MGWISKSIGGGGRKKKYMDRQLRLFDTDGEKWEMIQFRVDPDLKEDIQIWCKQQRLPLSVLLRMLIVKIIDNRRTYPGYQTEPVEEIKSACEDVLDLLPTILKHRKVYGRNNGGNGNGKKF